MAMNVFNAPDPLEMDGNLSMNWKKFYTKFDNFMEASNLSKESKKRKVAILFNLIGDKAVEAFNSIEFDEADKEDYDKVIAAFKNYCNPRKKILYSRFLFYNRHQDSGESFDNFYTDVCRLIADCEFNDQKDSILRDRLVLGLRNKELQAKLIRMSDDEVTLKKVVEFCRIAEQTQKQLEEVQREPSITTVDEVKNKMDANKMTNRYRSPERNNSGESFYNNRFRSRSQSESNFKLKCKFCNFVHYKRACPALDQLCRNCQKKGHFSSVCKFPKKKVDSLTENNDFLIESLDCAINTIDAEWFEFGFETLMVENIEVKFKLDTGAAVNVIPENVFRKLNLKKKLKSCKGSLQSFGGHKISPTGAVDLLIESKKGIFVEEFIIVKAESKPILGLKTCYKLGLVSRNVDLIENDERMKFIEANKDIFTGLGKLPKKYSLSLKPDAVPVSKPPNRIPLALTERVKEKLNEMSRMGVISEIEYPSEWISKMVIVEKPNGKLRLCLDPKYINMNLNKDYFAIPTLDEIKCKLSNKKYFSVLDLKDGFWQVELDDRSSKLCSFSTPFGCYKFNRLPFGLNISSEVFQKYNSMSFSDLKGVVIYLDDILVTGETKEDHDLNLKKLIDRARQLNVKFNPEKFQYCVEDVKYLGHIFSINGMQPDPDRISSIVDYKKPQDKKDLHRDIWEW